MASEVALVLLDQPKGTISGDNGQVAAVVQIGRSIPTQMSLLSARLPSAAGQVHLEQLVTHCDTLRDLLGCVR